MISVKELVRKKGRRCHYCNEPFKPDLSDATRDHVIARINGGTGDEENLVPACEWCNTDKSAMGYEEFLMKLPEFLEKRPERIARREAKKQQARNAQQAATNRKLRERLLQDQAALSASIDASPATLAERRAAYQREIEKLDNIKRVEAVRRVKRKRPKTVEPKPERWVAEKMPLNDAFIHQPSLSCACKPQVIKIRGGHQILEHREMSVPATPES